MHFTQQLGFVWFEETLIACMGIRNPRIFGALKTVAKQMLARMTE